MTNDVATPASVPRKRPLLGWAVVVAAIAAVGAYFLAKPAGETSSSARPRSATAESPFAAWTRLRDAVLARPPSRIRCEILEQDGSKSWSTNAEIETGGDGARVVKHNGGPAGGDFEASFAAKKAVFAPVAGLRERVEVALVEPLEASLLPTWLDYGMGGVLAAVFDDPAHVEPRLRAPASSIGPFVPTSVRPDAAGGTVVDGVIVSAKRRIEVTLAFGSDGRPTRRDMRDPTPPKLASSLERYTYGESPAK